MDIKNSVAAVTGANRGLGRRFAAQLLERGAAKVYATARNPASIDLSSRTCPRQDCGHVAEENRPTQEKFQCVRCGYTDHADRVGARNIAIRAGLVLPDVA